MKTCALSATSLLFGSFVSFAVADTDPGAPVIVTATRTALTEDESLASVTVITREQIERLQAQSIQELLRGVAGVDISNNGGPGKATSVFLRGTESDHVLVLIDGVKVGSATLGTTSFQDIPVEQIERIEIVRGPRSSLYGSEAIGGVIQIFTRKGGGTFKPYFSLGGGTYSTHNASAGVSGGGKRGWFNLGASGIDTEGFNACDGKPSPGGAGCFTNEPDKDGYYNLSGSLRGGYQFENGLEVDVHALYITGDTEFDGSYVNESESVQEVFGGRLRFSPQDIWQVTFAAGQSRDESDNFKDDTFQSRFNTERNTLSLQNDITFAADHLLTVGADYQDDRIDSTTTYAVSSRNNKGLFGQYQGKFGVTDVQFSVRRDDNEQFGSHSTGGVAWGQTLSKGLRITASYGTAFKAPTFNELYFPGFGNSDLQPETSRSLELGLRGNSTWGRWSLNAYETKVDDLIAFDATTYAPANIDQAHIYGFEVELDTKLDDWVLNLTLTLLDPENRSGGANDGNVLPRRARQSLRIDADRDFDRYSLGATLVSAGRRYDDLANTRELAGYATIDLRAEYIFSKAWRAQARIENLFNKDYETAAFFNQSGRSVYLTLRYQP